MKVNNPLFIADYHDLDDIANVEVIDELGGVVAKEIARLCRITQWLAKRRNDILAKDEGTDVG